MISDFTSRNKGKDKIATDIATYYRTQVYKGNYDFHSNPKIFF